MAKEKKKSTFIKDFKAFITKGNVIDMAVGVVIGGAFSKIVTGLVNYIINPCVGFITSGGNLDNARSLSDLKYVLKEAIPATDTAAAVPEVAILWGTWLQTILDFLITAFCIFLILRLIMSAKNKMEAKKIAEEQEKAATEKAKKDAADAELKARQVALEEAQLNQEKLLSEIRDLLKNK